MRPVCGGGRHGKRHTNAEKRPAGVMGTSQKKEAGGPCSGGWRASASSEPGFRRPRLRARWLAGPPAGAGTPGACRGSDRRSAPRHRDRKSTRLNSSHSQISYAVFCLKKKKKKIINFYPNKKKNKNKKN